ncbi:MAG: GDP-mannose 4,6-dehydratase [Chlamydiales bacterium]|nr:GDP-mannose 4,6-dehydratase [Chlamydiales bacterium]
MARLINSFSIMQKKFVFITGIAGFIGFHLAKALLQHGHRVIGVDDFNDYYSPKLKHDRANLLKKEGAIIQEGTLCHAPLIENILQSHPITHIVHLAAQAGVRFSLEHPEVYMESNIMAFYHLLEANKHKKTPFIFASSASVYGNNKKTPFHEEDNTDFPTSLYGATKKSNEMLAYSYHHTYQMPIIGLRFFTVYGPWGRPDMAYFSFTESILKESPIDVYGNGLLKRDFTYIDDIVSGIIATLDLDCGFEIFNLGNNHPETILSLIQSLEKWTGKKAIIHHKPTPPTDVTITYADIEKAKRMLHFAPMTSLDEGLYLFLQWHQQYI